MLNHILKLFFKIILILICMIVFNKNIFAENKKINCFKVFKFSLYNYGYFYSLEENIGIYKDIAEELEKRSKCKFEYILDMPRIRTLKSIENGTLDFTLSSLQTPDRAKYSYFSFYYKIKNFVIIRKEVNASSWNDFISNKNLKFGIVRGYKHGESDEKLEILKTKNRIVDYAEPQNLYEALKNNDIQAVLSTVPVYVYQFKKIKKLKTNVKIYDWNPQEKYLNSGMMMSKKNFSKEEVEKWSALIHKMRSDGTMMKIFQKYLSEKEAKSISLN